MLIKMAADARKPVRASRRGFSVVDLALSLAIICIMLAGVGLLYELTAQSSKFSDLESEVVLIDGIAHQHDDFSTISDQVISIDPNIPAKWKLPDGSLISPYGPITVEPWISQIDTNGNPCANAKLAASEAATVGNGCMNIQVYHILLYNLPDEACIKLLSTDFGPQEIEYQTWIAGIRPIQGVLKDPTSAESDCNGNFSHNSGTSTLDSVGLFFR